MYIIPYDAKRSSLYKPGDADDFFQFGPAQTQTEAALCAEMARLAYVNNESRLQSYLQRADFDLRYSAGYGTNGTQLFACQSRFQTGGRNVVVVSFRGTETEDPSDLVTDANFIHQPWMNESGQATGKIHSGFAEALLNGHLLQNLVNHLQNYTSPARILLTGHSLGAALATLTASYLAPTNLLASDLHLYTFGSPRVGDNVFAKSMISVDHARYVDCCDLVTRIPPEEFGFVHVGSLRYIDREGHVHRTISEDEISNDRIAAAASYLVKYSFLLGTVWVRELAVHSPINYVSGVSGLRP